MAPHLRGILVIDDAPDYTEFMTMLLMSEGYAVTVAADAAAAHAALDREQPDLVISDLHVWGMEPRTLIDRLDAAARTRGVPVLWCTGAVPRSGWTRDITLDRPRTAILAKPFDIDTLLALIDELLR
jgi:DNA-binding response OmpR family regulator